MSAAACSFAGGSGAAVAVAYAGSLVDVMEHALGPAFERATGWQLRGVAGGSRLLANEMRAGLRRPDVFVSASPEVDEELMRGGGSEAGAAGGPSGQPILDWYVVFAEDPLVIAYRPDGPAAGPLRSRPWWEALAERGMRLGRTDPALDPKGELAVVLVRRQGEALGDPGLVRRLLGPDENAEQVFPEEDLVGRLASGHLDAAFLYRHEAEELGLPYVLPDPALGARAVFTVAIPRRAPHPDLARSFVLFLLGREGRAILADHGLPPRPPEVAGDLDAVPAAIRAVVGAGP
ncbi:MAG: substrate-binding domain-containing protein [Clostridia bacterium]|nr:substrate-binding domain-containing protein [Clostridia bacterium]